MRAIITAIFLILFSQISYAEIKTSDRLAGTKVTIFTNEDAEDLIVEGDVIASKIYNHFDEKNYTNIKREKSNIVYITDLVVSHPIHKILHCQIIWFSETYKDMMCWKEPHPPTMQELLNSNNKE